MRTTDYNLKDKDKQHSDLSKSVYCDISEYIKKHAYHVDNKYVLGDFSITTNEDEHDKYLLQNNIFSVKLTYNSILVSLPINVINDILDIYNFYGLCYDVSISTFFTYATINIQGYPKKD